MTMNINIITLLYDGGDERIQYYEKYISSINKSYNLDKVNFFIFAEPHSERMIDLIPTDWNVSIFKNYYRFKPVLAHYIAFNYCFNVLNLDHAFLIEDDIIVSPDIFNLIEFWRNSKDCFDTYALCAINKHRMFNSNHELYITPDESGLLKLHNNTYFSGWGTGFSKRFWETIMFPNWKMHMLFDTTVSRFVDPINILSPIVSRTNQIGEVGFHYDKESWDDHGFKDVKMSYNYTGNYRIYDTNYA